MTNKEKSFTRGLLLLAVPILLLQAAFIAIWVRGIASPVVWITTGISMFVYFAGLITFGISIRAQEGQGFGFKQRRPRVGEMLGVASFGCWMLSIALSLTSLGSSFFCT